MNFFKKQQHQDPAALAKAVDTSINVNSVTIPKYRVKGNFVEYVIECTRNSSTWQVFRRYQQFKSLDAQLRALCPMGSPNHCEYGVVPALAGSSWTEVTNQSPELVERRRRYLEIYLQQLLVPKNLFYAAKTALFAFLHDGEVPVMYKTRSNKPLLGLGTVVEDGNEGEEIDAADAQPRQVVGLNRQQLLNPDAIVAAAVPDYSASSTSRQHHHQTNNSGDDDEPRPGHNLGVYHERCSNCGHETEVDYDVGEWTPLGRCPICKVHAAHILLRPDGTIVTQEECENAASGTDPAMTTTESFTDETMCPRCNRPFSVVPKSSKSIDIPIEDDEDVRRSEGASPGGASNGAAPKKRTVTYCEQCQLAVEGGKDSTPPSPPAAAAAGGSSAVSSPVTATQNTLGSPPKSQSQLHQQQQQQQHVVRTDVTIDDFTLITTLGRGTFGKVMKVSHNATGQVYAMKVLNKSVIHKRRMIDYIKEEKNIMAFLPPHPFVVTLHFAFQNDYHIFLVLDYLPGGELYTHIYPNRNLREADARFYIAEVVLAVEHMHRFDVVHRDIKPENIVLDGDGHLKLTDFGLARMNFTSGRRRSFVGSAEYLAPETIQGDVQTKALDWWSVGVMLYEMLAGVAPFHASNNNDVYQGVLHKKLDLNRPCFSVNAQNLISRLLDKDARQRLQDPAKIRQHPFFAAIDWDALVARKLRPPFVPDLGDNDTKYFSRDFTAEWATVQKPGGCGRQTLELLTRRFSNFHYVDERKVAAKHPAAMRASSPAATTVGSPDLINPDCFVGVWRLVTVEMNTPDGKVSYPWGSEVVGILVYCTNGMFQMQLCPMRRHKFRNATQDKITRDEMADAYLSFVAVFGTYEVTPGTNFITHIATGALCPNLVGVREKRFFELREKQLLLSTRAMDLPEGITARTTITWERVAGSAE